MFKYPEYNILSSIDRQKNLILRRLVKILIHYLFAIFITIFFISLKNLLPQELGIKVPYLMILFAVFLSAYFGGFGAGLFAAVLSAFAVDYFFVPPLYSISFDSYSLVRTGIYLSEGIIISWFLYRIMKSRTNEHRQKKWFESTLSSIGDAVVVTNHQGKIVFMNQTAERLIGWKSKRVLGQDLNKIFHIINERTKARILNPVMRVIKEKRAKGLVNHTILINKKGLKIAIDESAAPIKDIHGNITGVVLVFRDIAEKKRIQEELLRSKENIVRIFECITEGVVVIDRYWRLKYLNDEAAKIGGFTKEDVLGKTVFKIIPKFKDSYWYKVFQKTKSVKTPTTIEYYSKLQAKWYECRLYPLDDGIVIYFHNITERKLLEDKKDEFITLASHELKTPLTTIKAYIQILEKLISKLGNEKAKIFIFKTNLYISRLQSLIEDFFDVSKIQAGKMQMNMEEFDIYDLIQETVESIQLIDSEHKIIIKNDLHQKIIGDKHRLEQVLNNLLSNAVKYSPNGDGIEIETACDGKKVKVSVLDHGMGIQKNMLDKIFNRFYRAETTSQKIAGLGIGLYISKEIIKRHKGEIWVESALGKGSTFSFQLPIRN